MVLPSAEDVFPGWMPTKQVVAGTGLGILKAGVPGESAELLMSQPSLLAPETLSNGLVVGGGSRASLSQQFGSQGVSVVDELAASATAPPASDDGTSAHYSGDCAPKCTWKCESPKCDEVCTPVCHAPKCETRCLGADLSTCTIDCGKPHCTVVCPERPCAGGAQLGGACPTCKAVCGEPTCKLRCSGQQPCHNVCEQPECEWKCQAPAQCPAPRCQMMCEKGSSCMTSTYRQLPPLRPGETPISTFSAPSR